MPLVDVPDVGTIEFPDEMSSEDIEKVLAKQYPGPHTQGPLEPAPETKGPDFTLGGQLQYNPLTGPQKAETGMESGTEFTEALYGRWKEPLLKLLPDLPGEFKRSLASAGSPRDQRLWGTYEGVSQTLNSLTSPENLAILAATGGSGRISTLLPKLIGAGFAAHMGKNLATDVAQGLGEEYGKPPGQRDETRIGQLLGQAGVESLMIGAIGKEMAPGRATPVTTPEGTVVYQKPTQLPANVLGGKRLIENLRNLAGAPAGLPRPALAPAAAAAVLPHGQPPAAPAVQGLPTSEVKEPTFKLEPETVEPTEKGEPSASGIQEAAEVHGDLRTQPVGGEGEVPPEVSSKGIQPRPQEVAQETQVSLAHQARFRALSSTLRDFQEMLGEAETPGDKAAISKRIAGLQDQIDSLTKLAEDKRTKELKEDPSLNQFTPEELAYIDEHRKEIGVPIDIVDTPPDPDQPFGKGRRPRSPYTFMQADRNSGTIQVFPAKLKEELSKLPENMRSAFVKAYLHHEQIHMGIPASAGEPYWGTLSGLEKMIVKRRYTGYWGAKYHMKYNMSDSLWGQEALRMRIEQLAGPVSELAGAIGRERWTLKNLAVAETAIRAIRERVGTEASKEGLDILDRAQNGINVARSIIESEPAGAEQRKIRRVIREPGESEKDFLARIEAARAQFKRKPREYEEPPRTYEYHPSTIPSQEAVAKFATPADFMNQKTEKVKIPASGPLLAQQRVSPEAQVDPKTGKTYTVLPYQGTTSTEVGPGGVRTGAVRFATDIRYKYPSYKEFVAEFGGRIPADQRRAAYEDAVWEHVMNAAPERLTELRAALGLDWYGARKSGPVLAMGPGGIVQHKNLPGIKPEPRQVFGEIDVAKAEEAARDEVLRQTFEDLQAQGPVTPELAKIGRALAARQKEEGLAARKRALANNRYRTGLQTLIAERLIRESMPDTALLDRKSILPDELDFEGIGHNAWKELLPADKTPEGLYNILSKNARRFNSDAVTVTRRLVAMKKVSGPNKGDVALVSGYPRRGDILVTDPDLRPGARSPYRRIEELRGNGWDPFATGVLKDPVQKYYRRFTGEGEFNDYLGDAVKEGELRAQRYYSEQEAIVPRGTEEETPAPEGASAQEAAERLTETEPAGKPRTTLSRAEELAGISEAEGPPGVGEGVRGEGGTFIGPLARTIRDKPTDIRELRELPPLTHREALAIRNFIQEESQASGNTLSDIQKLTDKITSLAKNKALRVEHFAAINAVRKAAEKLVSENRQDVADMIKVIRNLDRKVGYKKAKEMAERLKLTPEGAYAQALSEYHRLATDPALQAPYKYLPAALDRFGTKVQEPGGKQTGETGRELTMRERRSPTDVARSFAAPGPPITARAMPPEVPEGTTTPTVHEPLSAQEQARVEKLADQAFGYSPTPREGFYAQKYAKPTGEIKTYPKLPLKMKEELTGKPFETSKFYRQLPTDEPPGAMQRRVDEAKDRFRVTRMNLANSMTRRSTKAEIYANAEGAQRTADYDAITAGNRIRLAALDPMQQGKMAKVRAAAGMVEKARRQAAEERLRGTIGILAARGPILDAAKQPTGKFEIKQKKLNTNIALAKLAIQRAEAMMARGGPVNRIVGSRWRKGAVEMLEIAEFAKANYKDPRLTETVAAADAVDREHVAFMDQNGVGFKERRDYIPGIYDGELLLDGEYRFSELRILGQQYRLPKRFDNPFVAIADGPYVMVNKNIADLRQHSVAVGSRLVNNRLWFDTLRGTADPVNKKAVAINPVGARVKVKVLDEEGNPEVVDQFTWAVPPKKGEYDLVYPDKRTGAKPLAVLHDYAPSVEAAMATESALRLPFFGEMSLKPALFYAAALKHGVVLMWDTFHPARLLQYAAPLGGRKWNEIGASFMGGYSALNLRPEDMQAAVDKGFISADQAKWATEPITLKSYQMVRTPTATGSTTTPRMMDVPTTRQALGRELLKSGLNATRITDALYRDAVKRIPFIGEKWHKVIDPVNKIIFDKITSGLMLESAVSNFERMNLKNPEIPYQRLARDVVRDINVRFGNMGKQGIFKSPTFRDMAQIMMLAPFWQEGLIQSEARFAGRLAAAPFKVAGRMIGGKLGEGLERVGGRPGLPVLGTLGRGMARGLAAYFIASQVINLVTRHKLTLQEEDNKLDARIPIPGTNRFWLFSPLSVFAETTHSLLHLLNSRPSAWAALEQFGANKMGPLGNAMMTLGTGKTREGEEIVAGSRTLEAAKQLFPAPITLAPWLRAAGHAVAPGLVAPNRPGVMGQRMAGMVGVKVAISDAPETEMYRKAEEFVKREGLETTTGWKMERTDEPSYTKLRHALRNNDDAGAKSVIAELKKNHTDEQIFKAMRTWSKRPFTGSNKNENLFRYSLSDQELETYYQSQVDRQDLLSRFYDLYGEVK